MWLHSLKHERWRELLWSMSWLRPGDKFDKRHSNLSRKTLIQNALNTKENLGFYNGYI